MYKYAYIPFYNNFTHVLFSMPPLFSTCPLSYYRYRQTFINLMSIKYYYIHFVLPVTKMLE